MELKNISSMVWVNMVFATPCPTKRHWCFQEKYTWLAIHILILLVLLVPLLVVLDILIWHMSCLMAKDFILRIIGDIGTDGAAYKAMQFGGTGVYEMSVDERLTLTNMTTEAGAKNGIIEPDQKITDHLAERGATNYTALKGDSNAQFAKIFEYEASEMEPTVAKPFSPQNVSVVRETSSIELDKAYIGSCTGAKFEDLKAVAKILKGRKVKIRTEILPAAISIYRKALENGFIKIFLDAGAMVGPPTTCAWCGVQSGHRGNATSPEESTKRNFPGRM